MKNRRFPIWSFFDAVACGFLVYVVVSTHAHRDEGAASFVSTPPGVAAQRNIASIEKVFDFSYLEGTHATQAAKKRMASSMAIEKNHRGDEVLINLGNFVLQTEAKTKDFACGYYDRVVLVFEAEGMAVSGEKPLLQIESGCQIAADVNELLPIRIPLAKLRQEKPGDTELKFYDGGEAVSLAFTNTPSNQWPNEWHFKEAVFKSSRSVSRVLKVDSEEVRAFAQKPVVMNW